MNFNIPPRCPTPPFKQERLHQELGLPPPPRPPPPPVKYPTLESINAHRKICYTNSLIDPDQAVKLYPFYLRLKNLTDTFTNQCRKNQIHPATYGEISKLLIALINKETLKSYLIELEEARDTFQKFIITDFLTLDEQTRLILLESTIRINTLSTIISNNGYFKEAHKKR
jgi:hypothetical protein